MPTDRARIQVYLEPKLYQKLIEWKEEREISKISEALNQVVAEFFGVFPQSPIPNPQSLTKEEINEVIGNSLRSFGQILDLRMDAFQAQIDSLKQEEERRMDKLEIVQSLDLEIADLSDKLKGLEQRLQILEPEGSLLRKLLAESVEFAAQGSAPNSDINDGNLELIVIEGRCPSCHCDDMTAIPYEIDNEVFCECLNCGWQKTYVLSAAKEWGYIPFRADEGEDDLPGESRKSLEQLPQAEAPGLEEADSLNADLEGDTDELIEGDSLLPDELPGNSPRLSAASLPEFLNAANLARRLGISKSVISRRKSEATFEEWSKRHDPAGIGWRFPGKGQRFFPVL